MTEVSEEMSESEGEESDVFEEYDLGGFTREEVEVYNRMASPGSRLKRKRSVPSEDEGQEAEEEEEENTQQTLGNDFQARILITHEQQEQLDRHAGKRDRVFNYICQHAFCRRTRGLELCFTSQRRNFERDIYDYARALDFSKQQAEMFVKTARSHCKSSMMTGNGRREVFASNDPDDVEAETSAWEGEVDDSMDTLRRLEKGLEGDGKSQEMDVVLPSIEDPETREDAQDLENVPDEKQEHTQEAEEKSKPKKVRTEAQKEKRRQKDAEKRRLSTISKHFPGKKQLEGDFHSPMMRQA